MLKLVFGKHNVVLTQKIPPAPFNLKKIYIDVIVFYLVVLVVTFIIILKFCSFRNMVMNQKSQSLS